MCSPTADHHIYRVGTYTTDELGRLYECRPVFYNGRGHFDDVPDGWIRHLRNRDECPNDIPVEPGYVVAVGDDGLFGVQTPVLYGGV